VAFHIVLSRFIDFDSIMGEASRGLRPRHAMKQLADRLDATIHYPAGQIGGVFDSLRSKLIGSPLLWAYARDLAGKLSGDDVVYCPDEEIGLPLAAVRRSGRDRPKIAVMVHNVDRPRAGLALRLSPGCRSVDAFLAVSHRQLDFLRDTIGIPKQRMAFVPDQTDAMFFKPGPASDSKKRPLLVSAGLEKRDYRILAEAAAGLDVDVCITGFSADTRPGGNLFPDPWPPNFSRRRYEWPELAQLYRDADAVVVTLVPNIYAAGITTIVEGMASGKPVIVTNTEGLKGYLDDTDAITSIPPGHVAALRNAIVSLLESPETARSRGERAHDIALQEYSSEAHVEILAGLLEDLRAS